MKETKETKIRVTAVKIKLIKVVWAISKTHPSQEVEDRAIKVARTRAIKAKVVTSPAKIRTPTVVTKETAAVIGKRLIVAC